MNGSNKIGITDEMAVFFRENFIQGDNEKMQLFLSRLREKGFSNMQIAFMLVNEENYSVHEADKLILNGQPGLLELLIDKYGDELNDTKTP